MGNSDICINFLLNLIIRCCTDEIIPDVLIEYTPSELDYDYSFQRTTLTKTLESDLSFKKIKET
jgi:hypothetical protein